MAGASQAEEAAQPGGGAPGQRAPPIQRALPEEQLPVPLLHLPAHRRQRRPLLGQAVELLELQELGRSHQQRLAHPR